jgi:hypothetical protein
MLLNPKLQTHHRSLSLFSQSSILTIFWCCGCCVGALLGEGGALSSIYVGALLGEGGVVSSSSVWEEQGKQGALLRGAWSITTYYCGGVGEHCYIQECCCEQSEIVWGTTLQEEQNEVVAKAMLWKERCWCKFATTCFFFSLRNCTSYFFLTSL